jgi:hypothetical protein
LQIRHCVEEANVDENKMMVIDPLQVRHVTVLAGKIDSMSGLVDPASHLNLDFPDHRITTCIIAEKFEKGARVKMDDDGMLFATVDRSAYKHYGMVDYTQRLTDMISVVKKDIMMTMESSKKKEKAG